MEKLNPGLDTKQEIAFTTHYQKQLKEFLPTHEYEYYRQQWKRIQSTRIQNKIPLILEKTDSLLEKENAFFWKGILDEITQNHLQYSLAKVALQTDLSLSDIKEIFMERPFLLPFESGVKLLKLHRKVRRNLLNHKN